jgi:hypothetical protein
MAGRVRISVTNLLEPLASYFSISAQANYPITNLRYPQRALMVWKSTSLVAQAARWDFTTAPTSAFGFLYLVTNVNTATVRLQGNATDVWTTPTFNQVYTVPQDPITGRRNLGIWLRTWPYRYLSAATDVQSTLDGQSVYQSGGIWFGPCLDIPAGLLGVPMTLTPKKPRQFQESYTGSFEEYADLGPARVQLGMTRRSQTNRAIPGIGDDLAKWLALDRQWGGVPAGVLLHSDSTSYAWVMRNTAEMDWSREGATIAKNTVTLIETLGP